MKSKYLTLAITLVLLLGMASPLIRNAKAETTPIVRVVPHETGPLGPGAEFTVSVEIVSPDIAIWSGQIGIGFNKDVLECLSFAKGPAIDPTWLWMPGTIRNDMGYVTYSGWSCIAGQEPGWTGTGVFMTFTFRVKTYYNGNITLDLTNAITEPSKYYRTKLTKNVNGYITEITYILLENCIIIGKSEPELKHDLAIKSIKCLQSVAYVGDIVEIEVCLENKGDFNERCNVTLYADQKTTELFDEYIIGATQVMSLNAKDTVFLSFFWNTSGVKIGSYWFSATLNMSSPDAVIKDNILIKGAYLGGICERPGERRFDLFGVLLQLIGSISAIIIALLICVFALKILMAENPSKFFRIKRLNLCK